jgi:glycosyltransferase involved in cell wall biosynthesis
VIHLFTPEYLPKVGGVADYTRQVARGLAEAGEDVHVWCPATSQADRGDAFTVHAELGQFEPADLARAGALLDRFDAPRRVLVQWVPHGFGRRSMNVAFCFWLWKRARSGDTVELMVHEPYLTFWEGTWRQTAAALVHRFMTTVLLRAASRVWISVPAWERMWKPYALGRAIPFTWLPIPSALGQPDGRDVEEVRSKLRADRRPIVGHLGTFGGPVSVLLSGLLLELFDAPLDCDVLLIGSGSEQFRSKFLDQHPHYANRLKATGALADRALAAHVAACDVLLQPYPDGITSRRTTAMAGLRLGVPIVTTGGYLTETLWKDSGAVSLTQVGEHRKAVAEVSDLLAKPERRRRMGRAGRDLYERLFDLSRTISALKSSAPASGRAA